MKFISNFSLAGILVGLIFAAGSFIRYFIFWPDNSQMVLGIGVGLLIVAVSFLYNWSKKLSITLDATEEKIKDFQDIINSSKLKIGGKYGN